MIFWVIILHALAHRVYGGDQSEISTMLTQAPKWLIALLVPFALLSLWGTAFSFLSGISGGILPPPK
jgi:H+/Cl- antiporter ClcA